MLVKQHNLRLSHMIAHFVMSNMKSVAFMLFSLSCTSAFASNFSVVPLGLICSEHTRNDGYQFSEARWSLNDAGQAIGLSNRYNGGSVQLGVSAWLFDGQNIIEIGLRGAEHTRSNGSKSVRAQDLNESGIVVGTSSRYNSLGISAWLYDGNSTLNIGLTDNVHTRSDGTRDSTIYELNEAGQVLGRSDRYSGNSNNGQTVWLYNNGTSIDIGLKDSQHTRTNGKRWSERARGKSLNEAGQAAGNSERYIPGNGTIGMSAWLYDGVTTKSIGLSGPEHTASDGTKRSEAYSLNQAGQVTGVSVRYNGNSPYPDLGRTAWLYNGAATIAIGLIGPEHTRNDGYQRNEAFTATNSGQVVGNSQRFNGENVFLGESVWFYNGTTTRDIGLRGDEHTRVDGYKLSQIVTNNNSGHVSGNSKRFNGGNEDLGTSAWFFNGSTTVDISLTSTEYTRSDGYRFSASTDFRNLLNESGQIGGYSERFLGGSAQLGQDAWLYDPVLDETFVLNLSTRTDGYAFSHLDYLGEDGLALGTYTFFDAFDNDLGSRAFSFTIDDGFHDLGQLVAGGLDSSGWDWLASAIRANQGGQLLGHGKLSTQSGGQMAFLLSPVPEPSGFVLLSLATTGIALARRNLRWNNLASKGAFSSRRG